jgi:photosystem II stability/assembly factor-like uncharacterized protein
VAAIAINPKQTEEVFASTVDGAIYMSADAGMKWKKQQRNSKLTVKKESLCLVKSDRRERKYKTHFPN